MAVLSHTKIMTRYLFAIAWGLTASLYSAAQDNITGSFMVNGITREYIIHLPPRTAPGKKLPLVLVFHGGGGNGRQMQGYLKMDPIADREHFICVYPSGINKNWNDGRDFKKEISSNDDVTFISQLLDTLITRYAADSKRVFATGISNGAFFSFHLAWKLSDRILAIAPVCGSIPEKTFEDYAPARPVSLLLINGTGDPLVPYGGGKVGNAFTGSRGNCTATEKTIEKYIRINGTANRPMVTEMPDLDPADGCTATRYSYTGGVSQSRVELVKITNGGHALPGGVQYLPKFIIGRVCRDFYANEMIWDFFSKTVSR
jgi:polyhydroxybutyrate depolymerase